MFQLSVCAETVFPEHPFIKRVKEILQAGFLVEFWNWQNHDIDELAKVPDLRIGTINGCGGGSILEPSLVDDYLKGVEENATVANKLDCRELIILAGELNEKDWSFKHSIVDLPDTKWITAHETLCRVADIAEKYDLIYSLENLNLKVDHPGYPLPHVEDSVKLVQEVGSPRLKILMDIYHMQVEEGNLIQNIRDYHEYIGYIHVADVPGRHEPGTGEINYPHVVQALRDVGYEGTIGLETFPLNDSREAMRSFRKIFTEDL